MNARRRSDRAGRGCRSALVGGCGEPRLCRGEQRVPSTCSFPAKIACPACDTVAPKASGPLPVEPFGRHSHVFGRSRSLPVTTFDVTTLGVAGAFGKASRAMGDSPPQDAPSQRQCEAA